MSFDPKTAKPVNGFDPSTAKPFEELPPDTTEGIVTSKKEVEPEYPKLFNPAKEILSRDYSNPYLKKLPSDVQQYMADNQIDIDNPTPTKDVFLAPEQVVKADGGDMPTIYKNRVAKGELPQQGVVGETEKENERRANLAFNAVDAIMKGDVPVTPLYYGKQAGKAFVGGAETFGKGLSNLGQVAYKTLTEANQNLSDEGLKKLIKSGGDKELQKKAVTGSLQTLEGGISTAFNVAPGSREFMAAINTITPIAAQGGEALSKVTGMDEATSQKIASLVMNIPFGKQMVIGALASSGMGAIAEALTQGTPLSDENKEAVKNIAATVGFVGGAHLSGSRTGTKILADLKSSFSNKENQIDLEGVFPEPTITGSPLDPGQRVRPPEGKLTKAQEALMSRIEDQGMKGSSTEQANLESMVSKFAPTLGEVLDTKPKTPFEKVTTKEELKANKDREQTINDLNNLTQPIEKTPFEKVTTETPSQIATEPTKDHAPAVPPIESGKSEEIREISDEVIKNATDQELFDAVKRLPSNSPDLPAIEKEFSSRKIKLTSNIAARPSVEKPPVQSEPDLVKKDVEFLKKNTKRDLDVVPATTTKINIDEEIARKTEQLKTESSLNQTFTRQEIKNLKEAKKLGKKEFQRTDKPPVGYELTKVEGREYYISKKSPDLAKKGGEGVTSVTPKVTDVTEWEDRGAYEAKKNDKGTEIRRGYEVSVNVKGLTKEQQKNTKISPTENYMGGLRTKAFGKTPEEAIAKAKDLYGEKAVIGKPKYYENEAGLGGETMTMEEAFPTKQNSLIPSTTKEKGNGFTDVKIINEGSRTLKDKLGEKKTKKYFDQANRLLNPNENSIVEYRENGIITKEGDKYIFNALSDLEMENWRISFKNDITDQFQKTPDNNRTASFRMFGENKNDIEVRKALNLPNSKKSMDQVRAWREEHKQEKIERLKDDLLVSRDRYNSAEGSAKTKERKPLLDNIARLRAQGVDAKFDNGKILIDGKPLRRKAVMPDKVNINTVEVRPEAEKRFEELSPEIRDRQEIVAENFVTTDDLPTGSGEAVLKKGIEQIKNDNGEELKPEAKIVRDAAEDILQNGKEVQPVAGGRNTREHLSPEQIQSFIDEKIERKGLEDEGLSEAARKRFNDANKDDSDLLFQNDEDGIGYKIKKFKSYGAEIKNGKVILYHGTDSKFKPENLRYNSYLSASEDDLDATGNMAASGYGKYVHRYELPIDQVDVTGAGEFLYKGNAPKARGKYPAAIYKAYSDVYGYYYSRGEIDAEDFDTVRRVASQGLSGGRDEFDELMGNSKLSMQNDEDFPDRTELQRAYDRKKHLELAMEHLRGIAGKPTGDKGFYENRSVWQELGESEKELRKVETQIKSLESKLEKAPKSQLDMFGKEQKPQEPKKPPKAKDEPLSLFMQNGRDNKLIAVHNLSADNLRHADKLGGIAVPSLAIASKEYGFDSFGEISLIAKKELIDPRASRSNKVFDADVYSPRYPEVSYSTDYAEVEKVANEVFASAEKLKDKFSDEENFKYAIRGIQSVKGSISEIKDMQFNTAIRMAFINENIKDIPEKINGVLVGEIVKEHDDAFKEYISKIKDKVVTKERIFKGFTYSGNRKYIPYTLDNIIKEMKGNVRGGESFFYGAGSVRANNAKQFSSIPDIQKSDSRILSRKETEKIKTRFQDELSAIFNDAVSNYSGEYGDARREFEYVIVDAAKSRNPKAILEKNGFGKMDADGVVNFLNELKNAPTEYFEAKIQRGVGLNEFKGAIVPKDVTQGTIDLLKRNGIERISFYDSAISGDRVRAINDFSDLMFQGHNGETGNRADLEATAQMYKQEFTKLGLDVEIFTDAKSYEDALTRHNIQFQTPKAMVETYKDGRFKIYLSERADAVSLNHEILTHIALTQVGKNNPKLLEEGLNIAKQNPEIIEALAPKYPKLYQEYLNGNEKRFLEEVIANANETDATEAVKAKVDKNAWAKFWAWVKAVRLKMKLALMKMFKMQSSPRENLTDFNNRVKDKFFGGDKDITGERKAEPGLRMQNDDQTKTKEFKKWFGESKVVNSKGEPLVMYRGDYRADKVGNEFRIVEGDEGGSGAIYFTSSPDVASSYSTNKPYIDDNYDNVLDNTTVIKNDESLSLKDANRELSFKDRQKIAEKIITVGEVENKGGDISTGIDAVDPQIGKRTWDEYLLRNRGNYVKAVNGILLESGSMNVEEYIKFWNDLNIFNDFYFDSPGLPKSAVTPVWLSIKNPIDTSEVTRELIDKFKTLIPGYDPGIQGLEDSLKNKFPETVALVTKEFREAAAKLGYDGIKDTGGIITQGDKHDVWIAFKPTQIKSATGNKGTFDAENPDIRMQNDLTPEVQKELEDYKSRLLKQEQTDLTKRKIAGVDKALAVKPEETPSALNKSEIEALREEFGIDKLEEAERKSILTSLNNAKDAGLKDSSLTLADQILKEPRMITDAEHAGMVMKSRDLRDEYNSLTKEISNRIEIGDELTARKLKTNADVILDQLDKLTQASDFAGREIARALNIRKMRVQGEDYDLASVLQRARVSKGAKLTDEEYAKFKQLSEQLGESEKEVKRLKDDFDKLSKENEKLAAQKVTEREARNARIKKSAITSREKILKERSDIKKELRALGFRLNDVSGITAEGSYLVGKLAVNYIKEGATNLNEVVQKVLADLPDLTERDVWQALNSRDPNKKEQQTKEANKRIFQIKRQAQLLADIKNAEEGIFKETKKIPPSPDEIAELRKHLTKLRTEAYRSELDNKKLEKALQTINELQDQLAGQFRNVKKKRPVDPPEMDSIKGKISELRRMMNAEDRLTDLQEQLRTGEFKVKDSVEKKQLPADLERKIIEANVLKKKIKTAIRELQPKTMGYYGIEAINTLRTMKASIDMSAALRQGFFPSMRRPGLFFATQGKAVKSFFDENSYEQIQYYIESNPNHYLRLKAGLELTEIDGKMNQREEMYQAQLIEKIPLYGGAIKASNRHMVTTLNLIRVGVFDEFLEKYPNATQKELNAWANYVNVATGRGDLGKFSQAAHTLSLVVFSPRFAISRLQTPFMVLKHWQEPRVRKEIAKDYAAFGAFAASALALAALAGFAISFDPDSSDFLKIKVGNTHIDLFAGLQQPLRLLLQIGKVGTDKVGLTEKVGREDTPLEMVGRFSSYKLAPSVTLPHELITGKTLVGEERDPLESVARSVVPMVYEDIYDAYKDGGVTRSVWTGTLNFFGASANTYEKKFNELRNLEEQRTLLKAKALKTKDTKDIEAYQAVQDSLESFRERDPEYKEKLKQQREKRQKENEILGKPEPSSGGEFGIEAPNYGIKIPNFGINLKRKRND